MADITVAVPHSAADVAKLQREAESDLQLVREIVVDAPDEYAEADAILTDLARKRDAVIAMRKTATVPLYQVIRTIEGWFRPAIGALAESEAHVKQQIGAYRLRQVEAEREAREAAAKAAEQNDAGALVEALTTAQAAAAPAPGRARVSFSWAIKRIREDLLPAEYWIPDRARLDAIAKAHKGDDPPVVPGVIFERVSRVGARR